MVKMFFLCTKYFKSKQTNEYLILQNLKLKKIKIKKLCIN